VNWIHNWLCRSERWRRTVERRLPWALARVDLGANVLELGPGPGLTTDLLRKRVPQLTAIEIDRRLAESLASRLNGSNVQVVKGDATEHRLLHDAAPCAHSPPSGPTFPRSLARLATRRLFCRYRQPAEPIYAADSYTRHPCADRSRHFWESSASSRISSDGNRKKFRGVSVSCATVGSVLAREPKVFGMKNHSRG
jgi:hypothetical protein